jgi:hypothetical protein
MNIIIKSGILVEDDRVGLVVKDVDSNDLFLISSQSWDLVKNYYNSESGHKVKFIDMFQYTLKKYELVGGYKDYCILQCPICKYS